VILTLALPAEDEGRGDSPFARRGYYIHGTPKR
jgi:hypothetical protein